MRLVPVLLLAVACRPSVPIQYLYPAEFTLPADVKTVAIVDRVGRAQSETAVQGLEDALAGSPRLTVANPAAAKSGLAAVKTPVGKPLDATSAGALCKAAGASGIVSLERYTFAGDWSYTQTTEPVTKTVTERPAGCDTCEPVAKEVTEDVPMVLARYDASLDTGWEVTSCKGERLTGATTGGSSWIEGKGERNADAREDAGDEAGIEGELADDAGASFSTWISPYRVEETRQYFGGGSKELAEGAKSAKAGDWKAAEKSWKAALDSDSPTVRGKARLNLAVAAERREALDEALENARAAKRLLDGGKGSAEYVRTLAKRVNLAKKVAAQVP